MHCRSPTKDVTHAIRLNACSEPDTVKEGSNASKKLHFVNIKGTMQGLYSVDLIHEIFSSVSVRLQNHEQSLFLRFCCWSNPWRLINWRLFMIIIICSVYCRPHMPPSPLHSPCSIAAWVSTFKEIVDLRRTVTAFIARARR